MLQEALHCPEEHLAQHFTTDDTILYVHVRPDFSLAQAVCSHGFYALAPNAWVPSTDDVDEHGLFKRSLRFGCKGGEQTVHVRVAQGVLQQSRHPVVLVGFVAQHCVDATHHKQLLQQIRRMIRHDMDLTAFHDMHPVAKKRGYGRTYRSPCMWEDMIKTFTNCNVTWKRTVMMNRLLCQEIGRGGFPTPHEIAAVDPDDLKARCNVGYRAPWIVELAKQVSEGAFDLEWFEQPGRTPDELYTKLLTIKGYAKFAASNILQFLGE